MLRYKACKNSIVTLELLNDTKTNEKRKDVFDSRYAKFRCNRAKVINITNVKSGKNIEKDHSIYSPWCHYQVGEIVKTNFDTDLNKICSEGIHYFKTEEAALSWFYKRCMKNLPDGNLTSWYENGRKDSEGSCKNGKAHGEWIEWYEDGPKFSEGTYKDGNRDGKWIRYHENGKKKQEGTYKNGEHDGKWIYWHENGQTRSEGAYKNGKVGKWTYWDDTGNKCYEFIYTD